jgi:hypothetical protein
MKKRLLCLLNILIIGALLFSLIGCLKEPKKETTRPEWKWYENEEFGFKLQCPADTKLDEFNPFPNGVMFKFDSEAIFFYVLVVWEGEILPSEEFVEIGYPEDKPIAISLPPLEESAEQGVLGGRIEAIKNITLDGRKAFQVSYSYENRSTKKEITDEREILVISDTYCRIFADNEGRRYIIVFSFADPPKPSDWENIEMIKNLWRFL